jgi:hypothetical protein
MYSSRCGLILAVLLLAANTVMGAQTGPLRLVLGCSQKGEMMFTFTIQNVSAAPTVAVIGTILGFDEKYLPALLELTVRRAGVPDTTLTYVDTSVPVIGGRVDPWLIFLPADASYSVAVPATNFRLMPNLEMESFSAPADLQLRLTTQEIRRPNSDVQGLSLIHVWVGTVTSDWIRISADCRL